MLSPALFTPERVVKRVKQPPHREGPKPKEKQLEQRPPGPDYLALRAMSGGTSLTAKLYFYKFPLEINYKILPDSVEAGFAR